jgi:peptidoglycan/xylan/chitin deacetylase (PgdA/CDA1 family)
MAQERNSRTLKGRMRQIAKSLVIRSGGLNLYHRAKHREVLTVLMLHRVLPQDLISAYRADEEYTISTTLLERLIAFLASHYTFVDLGDVLQSREKRKALPPYPILVTFDDGWDDNAIFASGILANAQVPWTLFAATDAISSGAQWWQESLLAILRSDALVFDSLKEAALNVLNCTATDLPSDRALAILMLYGALPSTQRNELIASHAARLAREYGRRDMADWDTLAKLQARGVHIGGHGASHLPLTMIDDPGGDLGRAQHEISQRLGDAACSTMSFPHGLYNSKIVRHASNMGIKLMFTSDPILNKCPGGWLQSDLIGRISISTNTIAGHDGTLVPERAMPWLMLRAIN